MFEGLFRRKRKKLGRGSSQLKELTVGLPFGLGEAKWVADHTQRRAAWALYVELVTRVSLQPLGPEEGLLREALSSLYTLFATTREILREAGPDLGVQPDTVGGVAVEVLNRGLRPLLSKWHPLLSEWEATRPTGRPVRAHEQEWKLAGALRADLEALRGELRTFAEALARLAEIPGS